MLEFQNTVQGVISVTLLYQLRCLVFYSGIGDLNNWEILLIKIYLCLYLIDSLIQLWLNKLCINLDE